MLADKACLGGKLVKKKIQILGDEFTETPGYYKPYHLKQVVKRKAGPSRC